MGIVESGTCSENDQVIASIDSLKRYSIQKNHSSTHLLHSSLKEILGKHISQKGSLVTDEKLRFDFNHNEIISDENIKKIENLVNKIIKENNPVKIMIQDHETAINSGAIALFGEKYGEEVRVVSMGKDKELFSKELCGGTHVENTGDINKFMIINQSSVASGIRRIEALTDSYVDLYKINEEAKKEQLKIYFKNEINKYIKLIKNIDSMKIIKLNHKIELKDQFKDIKKTYENLLNINQINENKKNIIIENIGEYKLICLNTTKYPSKNFKKFIDEQKINNSSKSIILLISSDEKKISIIIGITNDITDKFDAIKLAKISSEVVGGKGAGGRKDLAQAGGNQIENISNISKVIKKEILNLI